VKSSDQDHLPEALAAIDTVLTAMHQARCGHDDHNNHMPGLQSQSVPARSLLPGHGKRGPKRGTGGRPRKSLSVDLPALGDLPELADIGDGQPELDPT
jgi:hypothetical protein